jgi:hypothetical protein
MITVFYSVITFLRVENLLYVVCFLLVNKLIFMWKSFTYSFGTITLL